MITRLRHEGSRCVPVEFLNFAIPQVFDGFLHFGGRQLLFSGEQGFARWNQVAVALVANSSYA